MSWHEDQGWEAAWWGDCANTFSEQLKHPTYARLMGSPFANHYNRYVIHTPGLRVLDMGGGPTSMLLCAQGAVRRTVVDPCAYPEWTRARYAAAGVELVQMPGEEFAGDAEYDEAWAYNVLQHVVDPQKVVAAMRRAAPVIRMVEWVDMPPHQGHPHELKSEALAAWCGFGPGDWEQGWVEWDYVIGEAYNPAQMFYGHTGGK